MDTSTKGDKYINLNGLLIQWGVFDMGSSQTATVTFPKAFTDTNYSFVGISTGTMGGYKYDAVTGVTKTTTNATLYSYHKGVIDWIAIGV